MLATFFLGMSSVDQETQVVWMPLQCSQGRGDRTAPGEQGAQSRGQAARGHGEAVWRGPSLTALSVWWLTVGVVDMDGRRQPMRAPRKLRGAETVLGPGACDEPGSLPFVCTASTEKLGQAPSPNFITPLRITGHSTDRAQVGTGEAGQGASEATGCLRACLPRAQPPCHQLPGPAPSACSGIK